MEASKSKDDATKQDVVTAIKLWKVNPELYISQELAKSAIRKNLLYRGLPAEKKVFGSYRFPQFGIFPKEIQLMIWGMCAEEARLVEFHSDGTSDTVVPGMMHACAESRRVGLKIYEKISWVSFATIPLAKPYLIFLEVRAEIRQKQAPRNHVHPMEDRFNDY